MVNVDLVVGLDVLIEIQKLKNILVNNFISMWELKTKVNHKNPIEFLNKLTDEDRKNDSIKIMNIFSNISWYEPKMWGDSIIWFWSYHYKSERSKQEWDWPILWFSPRKQNITIYIMSGVSNYLDKLEKLGKHKASKWSCIYIKRLSDIDLDILKEIVLDSISYMKNNYSVNN